MALTVTFKLHNAYDSAREGNCTFCGIWLKQRGYDFRLSNENLFWAHTDYHLCKFISSHIKNKLAYSKLSCIVCNDNYCSSRFVCVYCLCKKYNVPEVTLTLPW